MALIGNIDQFDMATDQWASYKERLELFFAANEVADEKHVAVLLSIIGGKTYDVRGADSATPTSRDDV